MKLGIYGGTFNPPHLGHLTSARLALDALGLDELQFVPAALPPHKRLPPDAPGPEARLEMVELAADGLLLPGRESSISLTLTRPGTPVKRRNPVIAAKSVMIWKTPESMLRWRIM